MVAGSSCASPPSRAAAAPRGFIHALFAGEAAK